jgi:hypothetical protein
MTSNCSFKLGRMHLRTLLERWAFLVVMSVLACNLFPTVGAQTKAQPILSEEEKREAQHLSVTFTRRLSQTRDQAVVMDELFLPDSVERYLATEKRKVSDSKLSYIVFSSGVFVDVSLFEKPVREDWRRFYIATSNFVLLGFIHAIRRNVDFEEIKPTDLYPPEVIELLDANPMLRNLIKMKSAPRNFKSFEEMRSATATLSQAVALMHKALPGEIDLEEAVIQMAMRKSGGEAPSGREGPGRGAC